MTDTCQMSGDTADDVFDMLWKNFERSYNGNTRAPIGLYIHSAWFVRTNSWHFEGYKNSWTTLLNWMTFGLFLLGMALNT